MKTCSKCKQLKKLDEFSPNKEATDKKQSNCKQCKKEYAREKRLNYLWY